MKKSEFEQLSNPENLELKTWEALSGDWDFEWDEELLEKYKDKVDWGIISCHENVIWTNSILDKFKDQVN